MSRLCVCQGDAGLGWGEDTWVGGYVGSISDSGSYP